MENFIIGLPIRNKDELIQIIENAVNRCIRENIHAHPMNKEADPIFTTQEAADFLKISIKTLYTKMHLRQIKYSRPGKYAYFKYSDLLEYINRAGIATQYELEEGAERFIKERTNKKRRNDNSKT